MLTELTDDNFELEVLNSDVPCVILFTAGWCTFCDTMVPKIENLSSLYDDEVKFCVANIDQQKGLRITFVVGALPYVVFVRDGAQIPLFDETVSEERLDERIRSVLNGGDIPEARPIKFRRLPTTPKSSEKDS